MARSKSGRHWAKFSPDAVPSTIDIALPAATFAGSRVIDVGCGTGRLVHAVAATGALAVGIDINEGCVASAATQVAATATVKPVFLVGDAVNLPFRDESFDIGLLVAMLTVVPDAREREVIAAELARVLRPGGRMLIAEFGVTEKPNYLARYFETDPAREGGTLDVVGDDGTMLYRAHHFTEAELEVLVSNAGLVVREIVRQDFVSYTGNAVRGFVVSARREK